MNAEGLAKAEPHGCCRLAPVTASK